MGRTKVYNVFSIKMPLHTINNSIDYSETIANTKAGTFSIKVWILR
jgi:ribosomal protein S3